MVKYKKRLWLQYMLEFGWHDLVEFKIPSGVLSWGWDCRIIAHIDCILL